jgi:hypothetical protein
MLTIKEVLEIAKSEWEITLKKGCHPRKYRGLFLPDKKEVRIYLPEHKNQKDIDITILHEAIHIRDSIRENKKQSILLEEKLVEKEAKETYLQKPQNLQFLKELYLLY